MICLVHGNLNCFKKSLGEGWCFVFVVFFGLMALLERCPAVDLGEVDLW